MKENEYIYVARNQGVLFLESETTEKNIGARKLLVKVGLKEIQNIKKDDESS
ncbi:MULTISPECIES: hypothetical protein [Oceanobacillus]|uniref:Uncharacterized protein n=1 Tax=Oceanobacillus kimchii TaxID=746691 RepID=A0ABQ5TFY7_9BACI|nr:MULTISPECIES: hypothetical protein [Oceanobacillus]MBT2598908.1 hypothetical protein [Oceanobacillus sp. ISL-74]MBT2651827.1 hypothetical protein [Oceanobacillus sp. ISL-73]MCT1576476.1 hypothetical protein [Oceanobacillus kimchii]MCT2136112.1 hypothetical protein [Oceanobacillus kimchii]GLO65798.1 hypothetical protein MACH08_15820 [Oceanobacillus kimchii]